MISRVDHIAVAIKDHDGAEQFFCGVLGARPGKRIGVGGRNFYWQSLVLGDLTRLELVSPMEGHSFLDGFLRNREGGFHHMTLQTPDLEAMIHRLEEHGIPYFGKNEYSGGVWKEVFIHPRDAFGVLIQIAEFRADDWMMPEAKMPDGTRWELEKTDGGADLVFAHPGGGKVRLEFTRGELRSLMETLQEALSDES